MAVSKDGGSDRKRSDAQIKNDKWAFFNQKRGRADFDWRVLQDPLFSCAVSCIAQEGGAVMLGGAQGGGGAVVTFFINNRKAKVYVDGAEEFADWCHDVIESFGSSSEDVYAAWGLPRRGE